MATIPLTFPGAHGAELAGRLEMPSGEPRATALFAHCFTCSKESAAASRVSRALTDAGIAVLRFDFTGLGGSDGDFASTDFSSNVDDVVAAAEHLGERLVRPSLLIGHSLGGAAVIAAASRLPDVDAVVTIGAPADPSHVTALFADHVPRIEADGSAKVTLAGREFCVRKEFLEDLDEQKQTERIASMKAALLILHSPVDQTVGVENARTIYDAARHPKSFIALDGADHLLTNRRDSQFVADLIGAWASRHVPELSPEAQEVSREAVPEHPEGSVVVETGEGRFGQVVHAGSHQFVADEPKGTGNDTGPNPYDFLLTALGTCTTMTLQEFARRKKWPLESVRVELQHSRVHADDCESCEDQTGQVDRIERVVHLAGELDDEQRTRLLQIADRCPVHRTLHNQIDIPTRLAG